jgi:hypothetical protein
VVLDHDLVVLDVDQVLAVAAFSLCRHFSPYL